MVKGDYVTHAIPTEILDDRLAFIGTSGSGKTFSAKGAVERLLDLPARVCVVDPLSVWWGLRSTADGQKAAYQVVVFGGQHADVQITEDSATALARLIADGAFSCIIDLGDFGSGAARRRFMVDFMEELYKRNREPLHLILDEADLWAPQRPMPDQTMLLNRTEEIVRRGRVRGFIPWLLTQRPAVVHKDVLSQADAMIALKLTSTQDRDAFGDWIEGNADKAEGKRIRGILPTLQKGEGFVWAPSHNVLKQVKFPLNKTFDSSRTPKRGETISGPAKVAAVDIAAIRVTLADVEEKVKEDDPKHLKDVIKGLRRELKERDDTIAGLATPNAPAASAVYQDGYAAALKDAGERHTAWLSGKVAWLRSLSEQADSIQGDVQKMLEEMHPAAPIGPLTASQIEASLRAMSVETHHETVGPQIIKAYRERQTSNGEIPGGGINLLRKACELHPVRLTWGQITALQGRKARGGTFNHQRKVMLEQGLVAENGEVVTPTDAAFALTGIVKSETELPTAKLRELWQEALPDPAGRMFAALVRRGHGFHRLEQIASDLNMAGTGGHWNNGIATLRRNGLIEMQGKEAMRLAGAVA